jgi:DinB superfamily
VLEEVEAEFDDATKRAWQLVKSTDPRFFTVRPNPGSWSAAECLSHLSISTEMFLPVFRKSIDDAKAKGLTSTKKPSMDVLGRVLRWFLEPPIRSRVKTTAPFVPKAVRAKAEAFGEFSSLQSKLIDLLHEAEGLNLSKIKLISPFDKRVKYNLYSAFKIVVAHQRRHLWQAEKAVEDVKSASAKARAATG